MPGNPTTIQNSGWLSVPFRRRKLNFKRRNSTKAENCPKYLMRKDNSGKYELSLTFGFRFLTISGLCDGPNGFVCFFCFFSCRQLTILPNCCHFSKFKCTKFCDMTKLFARNKSQKSIDAMKQELKQMEAYKNVYQQYSLSRVESGKNQSDSDTTMGSMEHRKTSPGGQVCITHAGWASLPVQFCPFLNSFLATSVLLFTGYRQRPIASQSFLANLSEGQRNTMQWE